MSDQAEDMRELEGASTAKLLEFRTATDILIQRINFMRQAGITFNGKRDEYEILGYDRVISTQQYRDEYARGGIAGRIVDVFPNATWRGSVEVIEDPDPNTDTEFEKAWKDLEGRLHVVSKLLRADKLAGLSSYSVLLIGAEGNLEEELPRGNGQESVLYLTPFSGGGGPGRGNADRNISAINADCTIQEYDIEPNSPRFGLPKTYQLARIDIPTSNFQRSVHWTRVIHIAEGLLYDDVFGQPSLERVWNLLIDLRKVTGGGAEAFWLRANAGLQLNVDKDMQLPAPKPGEPSELDKLKDQAEQYSHQITRMLRTRGVDIKQLGSDVANFSNPADAILTQIAGAKAIPKRILTGSEMGELASSQDRDNWKDQVDGRQTGYAEPMIVRPLVDRLVEYGYLPTPKKGARAYEVRWPHIQTLTETEKADGAKRWAEINQANGEIVFTDAEIRDKWYSMEPLTDEQRQEIADRKAEAVKQAQEAMKQSSGPVPPESVPSEAQARAAERKFSSTQVQLPPFIAHAVQAIGHSIPVTNLTKDGLEDDTHVTVKFGLHTNDPSEVEAILRQFEGPVELVLGETAFFEGADYDVLYVQVFSPDLMRLNAHVADNLEVTDTHPVYIPHATIGYLKKGFGKKFSGITRLAGMKASISKVTFSPAEGEDSSIGLRVAGRAEEELTAVLTEAIRTKNVEVIKAIVGDA